jgi:protein PhnA
MNDLPNCPECQSAYTYEMDFLLVCPECGHEWQKKSAAAQDEPETDRDERAVRDAHGSPLQDGDHVIIIKDLKVKGASSVIKVGTKVKNIRLVDGDHDIDCKVEGFGQMGLKSEFVKKV